MIDIITITGGLVRDAELRFTPSGAAVAEFTVAQSDSRKNDANEWETTRSLYLPVTIWNENPERRRNPMPWAEMAANLQKGDRVAVRGKIHTRSWETKEGDKRSRVEMAATEYYVIPDEPAASSSGNWGDGGGGQSSPPSTGGFGGGNWGKPATTGQPSAEEEPPF